MIEINLLPKEYRKKAVSFALGKSGLYAVAAAAGVILMFIGVTLFQMHQIATLDDNIARARQRAAMLERDIKLVDALQDVKGKITRRLAAVEQLDSHRSAWVRILEDVAYNVPQFVWLGRISEEALKDTTSKGGKGDAVKTVAVDATGPQPVVRQAEVEGYAFTLNALAAFMIKMMRSEYFEDVELVSTDETKFQEQKAYNFTLACKLHYLSDEDLRNLIAQTAEVSNSPKTSAGELAASSEEE
ncbi:MAG: PilN domain-containing protein [Candidatus Zixiibacteriota bacterium]